MSTKNDVWEVKYESWWSVNGPDKAPTLRRRFRALGPWRHEAIEAARDATFGSLTEEERAAIRARDQAAADGASVVAITGHWLTRGRLRPMSPAMGSAAAFIQRQLSEFFRGTVISWVESGDDKFFFFKAYIEQEREPVGVHNCSLATIHIDSSVPMHLVEAPNTL